MNENSGNWRRQSADRFGKAASMLTRKKASVLWIYLGLLMLLGSWFRPDAVTAASGDNWKATLAKARQEGSLVLATSVGLPQYRQSLTSAFSRRFGISLEVRSFGTGAELDAVAGRECAAGRQTINVVQTGSGAPLHLYPKKCLTEVGSRLMLPEVVDPRKPSKKAKSFAAVEGRTVEMARRRKAISPANR
jgi:hypothetical protein